jgi:uncharacterized membrane protein (DUF2068 family)
MSNVRPHGKSRAIIVVALVEAVKGVVVLLAATGVLSLMHRNIYAIAATLVEHTHLNPASKYPRIFLDAASHVQNTRLLLLALGAATYASIRLVEAYGLFHERQWAEVLAAVSGAIYVPFELFELLRRPTWHGFIILLLNLAVVAVMVRALSLRRRAAAAENAS